MIADSTRARAAAHRASPRSPAGCEECITRRACLLSKVDSHQSRHLQPVVRQRSFKKGDVLIHEGQRSESVFVVKVGSVFGHRNGLDGGLRPIGVAGRGATFGVFGYFDQPNPVTIIAVSSGRGCQIPIAALAELAGKSPRLIEHLAAMAVRNCGAIAAWSEGMRVSGVVNQLAYAMLLMADAQHSSVMELPTQTALAQLLGTTRESVARALRALEKTGAVRRLERKKCEISKSELIERLTVGRAGR